MKKPTVPTYTVRWLTPRTEIRTHEATPDAPSAIAASQRKLASAGYTPGIDITEPLAVPYKEPT